MPPLKECDSLAKGLGVYGELRGGVGLREVSEPHRKCQRLSESALWMKSLWSARRRTGRFYKQ